MVIDVVDDHEVFFSVVNLRKQSFWRVAHFCDICHEALVSQLESVGTEKFHL